MSYLCEDRFIHHILYLSRPALGNSLHPLKHLDFPPIPTPAEGNIDLAMGEEVSSHVHPHSSQCLPLGSVSSHPKAETNWELPPPDGEGEHG